MEFRHYIKNRRIELGLTLDDVAKIVGVGRSTIQRWESGNIKNQRRDKLELLARALQVSPGEMLGWNLGLNKENSSLLAEDELSDLQQDAINMILEMSNEQLKQFIRIGNAIKDE